MAFGGPLLQSVADTSNGHEPHWSVGIGLDLGAQPAHMDIDRPGIAIVVRPPDTLQDVVPCEHASGRPREQLQQASLLGAQVDPGSIAEQLSSLQESSSTRSLMGSRVRRTWWERRSRSRSRVVSSVLEIGSESTSSTPASSALRRSVSADLGVTYRSRMSARDRRRTSIASRPAAASLEIQAKTRGRDARARWMASSGGTRPSPTSGACDRSSTNAAASAATSTWDAAPTESRRTMVRCWGRSLNGSLRHR